MSTLITKDLLRALREDINAALVAVGEKHGVTLRAGNCSFDRNGAFTYKVDGVAIGGLSRDESAYDQLAGALGLPKRGTAFDYGRKGRFVVKGMRARGDKVICTSAADGKDYLITIESVKAFCTLTTEARAA